MCETGAGKERKSARQRTTDRDRDRDKSSAHRQHFLRAGTVSRYKHTAAAANTSAVAGGAREGMPFPYDTSIQVNTKGTRTHGHYRERANVDQFLVMKL